VIILGEKAEDNSFACMLSELLRQNIEAKPEKLADIKKMKGRAAIVADDAGIAVTLEFDGLCVVIRNGIVGVPDITIRGQSEAIMEMSNVPITRGIPFWARRSDEAGKEASSRAFAAMNAGQIHTYGMWFHLPLVIRLTRLMSVN
jgi:hypothetical protein